MKIFLHKTLDTTFAKITPCMENGKIAIVDNLRNGIGFGSTEFHVIRFLNSEFSGKLFFYNLLQESIRKEARRHMTGTAGQLRVPVVYMQQISIPLPPLSEQRRIVVKIEALFTELDAGIEALKKAKAQLKRYRQAILKHAFEGKLTEEWREAHKDEIEPASVLLERIKEEKKKDVKGKKTRGDIVRSSSDETISEIASPSARNDSLSLLPEGWVWTRVKEIGDVITGTTPNKSKKEYYDIEFPFFKPADLNYGYYTKKATDSLSKKGLEIARLLPAKSILVTCIGTIGKTGFIRVEGASNQQINAIIPNKNILPEFIYFICISPQFQKSIIDSASSTTLPILNKSKFEVLKLPLSSLPEQQKIVEEIECHFSVADEVERVVEQGLKQAERLRQSILKTAFEGKLVPQDPDDEPAEKLLERIKEEKARRETEKKAQKGVKSSRRPVASLGLAERRAPRGEL